jgi:hypothetical protein
VYSVYDYLGRRFDGRTRGLAAASFICLKSGYLAVVIYAPSLVLAEILTVPPIAIVVTVGLGTAIYTLMGGIKGVIWTYRKALMGLNARDGFKLLRNATPNALATDTQLASSLMVAGSAGNRDAEAELCRRFPSECRCSSWHGRSRRSPTSLEFGAYEP